MNRICMARTYGRAVRDIAYAEGNPRGIGDLFLPGNAPRGNPVLLIHGGGWNGASKEFFECILPIFAIAGRPVFSINYRYVSQAPWPACGEDALAAGRFMLDGGLASFGLPAPAKILICGASSGGHLAMTTGLGLPREQVEAIVSMAGPSRIDWVATNRDPMGMHEGFLKRFFGREVEIDGPEIEQASPAIAVTKLGHVPSPLFCLHSESDLLCPASYSREAVAAWARAGGVATAEFFEGADNLHGFWVNSDRESDIMRPEVFIFFARVFDAVANTQSVAI